MIAAAPITADPPIHSWTRRMLLPAFAPRAVEKYSEYTEELCHQLIDEFIEAGECDAAVQYSQQIPPRVIAHMIGVDESHGRPVRRVGQPTSSATACSTPSFA